MLEVKISHRRNELFPLFRSGHFARASKHSSQYFIYSFSPIIKKQKKALNSSPFKSTYVRVWRILFIISNETDIACSPKLFQTRMKVNFAAGKHREFHSFCGYCTYSIIPVMIKCKSD